MAELFRSSEPICLIYSFTVSGTYLCLPFRAGRKAFQQTPGALFPSPQLTNTVSKSSRPSSALSKNLYSLKRTYRCLDGCRSALYKIRVCRSYQVCFLITACRYFTMLHTLWDIQLCVEMQISHLTLWGLELIILYVSIKIRFVHYREHSVFPLERQTMFVMGIIRNAEMC